MDWLERISTTCFAASYLVVFALEISRALFRASWWKWIAISTSLAGIFAHIVYMTTQEVVSFDNSGFVVGGWTGWFLGAALCLMFAYLWVLLRQGDSDAGLFIIPLVLVAIAIGSWPGQQSAFSPSESRTIWNTVHGMSLLLGTAVVGLGFLFGIMYLLQAWRLKQKKLTKMFRMPSLEWLQQSSEKSLLVSAALLIAGVVSGIAVNLVSQQLGDPVLAWNDPVVWTSAILLTWLLIALAINFFYRPVRPGKKIAYLVVACFCFFALEIGIVWSTGHAVDREASQQTSRQATSQETASAPSINQQVQP